MNRLWRWLTGKKVTGTVSSDAVMGAFFVPEGKRKERGVQAAIRKAVKEGKDATVYDKEVVFTGKGG